MATPALQRGERLIVFEQTEQDQLELLALETIHGVSRERTEMMFRFRPLLVFSRAPALHVRHAPGGKIYTEELSLERRDRADGQLAPAAPTSGARRGGVRCDAAALEAVMNLRR